MIRLDGYPHLYNGIKSNLCGLIFLSTPHSGSGEADWNKFLVNVVEVIGGVRADAIVNSLRSFNPLSARANEDFGNLKVSPPYECFYETRETKFRLLTLNSQPNGMPPIDARHYPLAPDRRWYEGRGLRPERQPRALHGRQTELQSLHDLLVICQRHSAIAVTGIGGIGKTEVLLEIARQQINQMNVFFIYAKDESSLKGAYHYIARQLGHLVIDQDRSSQSTALDIWNNLTQDEKVDRFKQWLRRPENAETLFLLDDLDGLKSQELISDAIPHEAQTILFSSRNPVLCEQLNRQSHHIRLCSMEQDDVVQIMEEMLQKMSEAANRTIFSREKLQQIAAALEGHPMASRVAIRYITRVLVQEASEEPDSTFLGIMQGSDFESRKHFLEYRPVGEQSIMDAFLTSRQRLQDPDGIAWKLMQFSAFLETGDPTLDFRQFFYQISRSCRLQPSSFPDYDVLTASKVMISEGFADIEAVSFGEPAVGSIPAKFHPIWLDCTLQCMGESNRIRYMRQVLMICHLTVSNPERGLSPAVYRRHVKRCIDVCKAFRLDTSSLSLTMEVCEWVAGFSAER
ncbi:P-loop containing nucleoside triphosphate hydrolase protein [Leptodontidium sp. 2 PMI_412]|nr:P-loop containing nucleoside triphosphate hydrolase protein [Leptodontidium sp. 2 PMI_412]